MTLVELEGMSRSELRALARERFPRLVGIRSKPLLLAAIVRQLEKEKELTVNDGWSYHVS